MTEINNNHLNKENVYLTVQLNHGSFDTFTNVTRIFNLIS